jgi:hypothetical protein
MAGSRALANGIGRGEHGRNRRIKSYRTREAHVRWKGIRFCNNHLVLHHLWVRFRVLSVSPLAHPSSLLPMTIATCRHGSLTLHMVLPTTDPINQPTCHAILATAHQRYICHCGLPSKPNTIPSPSLKRKSYV